MQAGGECLNTCCFRSFYFPSNELFHLYIFGITKHTFTYYANGLTKQALFFLTSHFRHCLHICILQDGPRQLLLAHRKIHRWDERISWVCVLLLIACLQCVIENMKWRLLVLASLGISRILQNILLFKMKKSKSFPALSLVSYKCVPYQGQQKQ